jgi:hypothetical protein
MDYSQLDPVNENFDWNILLKIFVDNSYKTKINLTHPCKKILERIAKVI